MSTVVRIPLSVLSDSQSVRELKGPGRTAVECLELLRNSPNADVEVDDEWSSDMREIIRENRAHDRDPWAE